MENNQDLLKEESQLDNIHWIKSRLAQHFPGCQREVQDPRGDDQHLQLHIVWAGFQGKSRIECHKMVYEALEHMRGGRIHALNIRTQSEPLT